MIMNNWCLRRRDLQTWKPSGRALESREIRRLKSNFGNLNVMPLTRTLFDT